MTLLNHVL